MYTHPGAKLLFMGNEFGQTSEWNNKSELQWELLQHQPHKLLQKCVQDLNKLYTEEPGLYEKQFEEGGFQWVDLNHRNECIMVYRRMGEKEEDDMLVILNMLPQPRLEFEVTVKGKKRWKEIFNSDSTEYWGTGDVYNTTIPFELIDKEEDVCKITVDLPPIAGIVLK
jgi:1,4-alpha-glucan branching enzyme